MRLMLKNFRGPNLYQGSIVVNLWVLKKKGTPGLAFCAEMICYG